VRPAHHIVRIGCTALAGQARGSPPHRRGPLRLHGRELSGAWCGPYRGRKYLVILAVGVAILNADWRERVGEGGGEKSRSSVAISISSPLGGGGTISVATVERLRGGGDGWLSQSLISKKIGLLQTDRARVRPACISPIRSVRPKRPPLLPVRPERPERPGVLGLHLLRLVPPNTLVPVLTTRRTCHRLIPSEHPPLVSSRLGVSRVDLPHSGSPTA